ncbi:hypothetical protein EU244_028575 [Rhodococcus qingshengii]|uniref:hypothetical protein n=1 Tax=Rhodococcus qingshengii TaxID=334542 RepID=UPI0010A5F2A3|nr:hypothetical protein [Rhodococcus qingshengii]THJ66130.1 hypothetical protein EU244_28290 [Rhodococcus qingshengii]
MAAIRDEFSPGRPQLGGDEVRAYLAAHTYRLRHGDDTLLPMVLSQLCLLNRSPHLEGLGTELFDRVRHDGLLGGARLNTVHAAARVVNALGFCDPPPATTDRGTARAIGGAQIWQQWRSWYARSDIDAASTGQRRCHV